MVCLPGTLRGRRPLRGGILLRSPLPMVAMDLCADRREDKAKPVYQSRSDRRPRGSANLSLSSEKVVRPRRFELLTYSFGGCRSIQLSYGRALLA
jgi:hypothetical protein